MDELSYETAANLASLIRDPSQRRTHAERERLAEAVEVAVDRIYPDQNLREGLRSLFKHHITTEEDLDLILETRDTKPEE